VETWLRRGRPVYGGGGSCTEERDLSTKGRDLSTEGKTCLWRGILVYGGGDSSTKGEALLGTILYEHIYVHI
jgi:hypothetical protein